MRYLYTILLWLFLPFIFLKLYWRGRQSPAYRHRWEERLGFVREGKRPASKSIWIHAVSVGEVEATVTLVKQLFGSLTDQPIVMTTTTPTGAETVQRRYASEIQEKKLIHLFVPYDLPSILQRFIISIDPQLVIVMETEVWPNMIHCCWKRNIPVILANARMAKRSYQGYKRLGRMTSETFSRFSIIAAQTEQDANRIKELGAKPENVRVSGSLKFDLVLPLGLEEKSDSLREQLGQQRSVWIAGSTHDGEEEQVLKAHQDVLKINSDCLLILVPRHPERFGQVFDLCESYGFKTARRSQAVDAATSGMPEHSVESNQPEQFVQTNHCQVYLVDTMGDLLLCYGAADIAFVAGSLTPIGGHNILEPASLGLPVLMGPHTFKIEKVFQDFVDANAAFRVHTPAELAEKLGILLANKDLQLQMGASAKALLQSQQGATNLLLSMILGLLEKPRVNPDL